LDKKHRKKLLSEIHSAPLLDVKNLKTHFFTEDGVVKAVDGLNFQVFPGEALGLVGESGCGKSVTSLSIMRLIGKSGRIVTGEIVFDGRDLLELGKVEMMRIRGNRISMIFQQPQSALNPVFRIGDQIAEVLKIHTKISKQAGWQRAVELLELVGIPDASRRVTALPHELSGGMAQRVMIAMALACTPSLLIADEPTTALDVTIQAQILDLIREMRKRVGTSVILITHDLGVIAEMVDRVAVMYAGSIIEQADVKELFSNPLHPYTRGLIASIPVLGRARERLDVIPGAVPNLIDLPIGCRFAPRCRLRQEKGLEICDQAMPATVRVSAGHDVNCWLYAQENEVSG
jgi:oligopeptide/dipeptide ABC transporter ATP-binding protein